MGQPYLVFSCTTWILESPRAQSATWTASELLPSRMTIKAPMDMAKVWSFDWLILIKLEAGW